MQQNGDHSNWYIFLSKEKRDDMKLYKENTVKWLLSSFWKKKKIMEPACDFWTVGNKKEPL